MQLVSIAFSHYNEKVRWGLEHFGVDYTDRRYLPLFHFAGVVWATRGRGGPTDPVSTRWSTPLLITEEGTRLHDSSQILRYLSDRFGSAQTTLYPAEHRARIEQLEQRAHDRIGPHTRRIAYFFLLREPERFAQLARDNVGRWQAGAFIAAGPLMRAALRKALSVDRAGMEASVVTLREEVAALGQALGERRYLVGERLTAADLSVACLLAPVLCPSVDEGYSAVLSARESLTGEQAALVEEVRRSRIGIHSLRVLAERRDASRGRAPGASARTP